MDTKKTGLLISEARKEKGLTQKELAEKLNVSDRTVSKWERGAGFPDVTLLEPISEELGIPIQCLLSGEREMTAKDEHTLGDVIKVVCDQYKKKIRRNIGRIIAAVLTVVLFGFFVYGGLEYCGVFLKDVSLEVPVDIYVNGEVTGSSTISISGKRGRESFAGEFSVACVEKTTRDGVQAYIEWNAENGQQEIQFSVSGDFRDCGIQRYLYISEDMTRIAIKLDDGTVVATDEALAALMTLEYYYQLNS